MWYRKSDQVDENGQPIIEGPAKSVHLRIAEGIPVGLILDDSNYQEYDGKYDGWHYSEEILTQEQIEELLAEPDGYWNRIKNWFTGLF